MIDENARADAHDIDNLHQVIDLNPTQILPATDENAVDSMDFENQMRLKKMLSFLKQYFFLPTVSDSQNICKILSKISVNRLTLRRPMSMKKFNVQKIDLMEINCMIALMLN